MKKYVSLFVALCMVFTMIPALAEPVSEESPIEEQTTEQEADLGELLGLLGGLFGGEADEGEEGAHPSPRPSVIQYSTFSNPPRPICGGFLYFFQKPQQL